MTIFNPENKEQLTYGDCLFPAMEITDKEDADQYLNAYAKFAEKDSNISFDQAIDNCRFNIIYWSGYYDQKKIDSIRMLFDIDLLKRKLPFYFYLSI